MLSSESDYAEPGTAMTLSTLRIKDLIGMVGHDLQQHLYGKGRSRNFIGSWSTPEEKRVCKFVFLVSVLNAFIFASREPLSLFKWPHQIYWVQGVSQEVLNVGVIATISVIWQPTEHSRLLVSMQQLNTDEFGDTGLEDSDDGFEMTEKGGLA